MKIPLRDNVGYVLAHGPTATKIAIVYPLNVVNGDRVCLGRKTYPMDECTSFPSYQHLVRYLKDKGYDL